MTLESPAARAGQIARQMLLFGRPIPVDELVAKIEAISVDDMRDLAEDIFTGSAPTLAAVGALDGMMDHDRSPRASARRSAERKHGVPALHLQQQHRPTLRGDRVLCARRRSATTRSGRGCARRAARSWRRGSRSGRPTT
jgi:hypothetical protein